jgi:hypothetical protein
LTTVARCWSKVTAMATYLALPLRVWV